MNFRVRPNQNLLSIRDAEENRSPVGRPVFKTGEGRQTSLVGSTPTLFRQFFRDFRKLLPAVNNGMAGLWARKRVRLRTLLPGLQTLVVVSGHGFVIKPNT